MYRNIENYHLSDIAFILTIYFNSGNVSIQMHKNDFVEKNRNENTDELLQTVDNILVSVGQDRLNDEERGRVVSLTDYALNEWSGHH
ncbi:MAG: hypothetical protein J6E46_06705 [Faecalicoccus sp.]|nr:hypothetical protein [Faecalicoccus sp.]